MPTAHFVWIRAGFPESRALRVGSDRVGNSLVKSLIMGVRVLKIDISNMAAAIHHTP